MNDETKPKQPIQGVLVIYHRDGQFENVKALIKRILPLAPGAYIYHDNDKLFIPIDRIGQFHFRSEDSNG